LQTQQAGYSNFVFTSAAGGASCSDGAFLPGQLGALADFSWISTDVVNTAPNATVTLPGTPTKQVMCDKYTRESNTQQWLCAVSSSAGGPVAHLVPILHRIGSDALLFTNFEDIDPSKYPPSSPEFQLPAACASASKPSSSPSQWQVVLGASVAAFVAGIVLAITTVRCRAMRQKQSDKHAYQTALLDVM